MTKILASLRPFLFDLYFKPSLLLIGIYQIVVSGTYTAQQLLLAAYLDELGILEGQSLFSGLILAIFFVFWFLLAPVFGTLSDLHGRKFLLIVSNIICGIGFVCLIITPHPLFLFIINGFLGIGSALRIGSLIALWVQHSPENRIGESMAYINIILGIGGFVFATLGFILWAEIREISFLIFGLSLILTAILIIPIPDDGNYIPFSVRTSLDTLKKNFSDKLTDNFFMTKPMMTLCIHWFAISAIVSFGTFLIPIFDRVVAEIPSGISIPVPLLLFIGVLFFFAFILGLIIWGRISDNWARRPVLIIGFSSTGVLILILFLIFQFDQISVILQGLASINVFTILFVFLIIILIFMMISLIPTPMAWIVDLVGKENVAKAMSLRLAIIALGTICGTLIGGYILGSFGISGLILVIFLFMIASTVILF